MKKRIISFLLVFCMVIEMFPISAIASDIPKEMKLLDTPETAYLTLEMEKYGEKITSSSNSSEVPTVDVLEWTEWEISAKFVKIKEVDGNKKKSEKAVSCEWSSTDDSNEVVTVEAGTVKVGQGAGNSYTITAEYVDPDADLTQGDGKYTAKITFDIVELQLNSSSKEPLRYAALSVLTYDKEYKLNQYIGQTVGAYINSLHGSNIRSAYIYYNDLKNSAQAYHFISAAAKECKIIKFSNISPDVNGTNAAAYLYNNRVVIAYSVNASIHSDSYYNAAVSFYQSIKNMGYSDIILTGQTRGGELASYVSYVTGCKAVTFNSFSALEKAAKINMNNLVKYYSGKEGIRKNYISVNETEVYKCLEDTYYVTQQSKQRKSDKYINGVYAVDIYNIFNLVGYNHKSEQIIFNVVSVEKGLKHEHYDRLMFFGQKILILASDNEDSLMSDALMEKLILLGDSNDDLTLISDDITSRIFKLATDMVQLLPNLIMSAVGVLNKTIDNFNLIMDVGGLCKSYVINSYEHVNGILLDFLGQMGKDDHIIISGKGNDKILGSWENDIYYYTPGDGVDQIVDFNGYDKLYFVNCENSTLTEIVKHTERGQNVISEYYLDGELVLTFLYSLPETARSKLFGGYITVYKGDEPVFLQRRNHEPQKGLVVSVACPVDVLVYDDNNNVIHTLNDGMESYVETEYGIFEVLKVDNEFVKSIVLFDDSYRIEIQGNTSGTMHYEAATYDPETDSYQYINFDDVTVKEGCTFFVPDNIEDGLDADWNGDGKIDENINYETEITLGKDTLSLEYGETYQMNATIAPESVKDNVEWVSTDTSVVVVDQNGLITTVGAGTAKVGIIAKDGSAVNDVCEVTVTESSCQASDFTVTGLNSNYDYTGDVILPEITVKYKDFVLIEGQDYIVECSEYVNSGDVTMTITGIDKYSGTKNVTYKINPPKLASTVEEKVAEVAALCRKENLTNEYDIALWLHDWLIHYANYDYNYVYYHADGVLLHKVGVCQSYAEAYQKLLNAFNIENQMISAPEMDHAWNLVKINGQWCHVDCTWDDPGIGGAENHFYFGMNDALMSRDHEWDKSKYPGSTDLQNYYYIKEGYPVFETKEEMFSILDEEAEKQNKDVDIYYVGTDKNFNFNDEFESWYYKNNWKYGLRYYNSTGNDWYRVIKMEYTNPWPEPDSFEGITDCPDFTLRGPNGTYPLSKYNNNGIILIFGRDGCYNTRDTLNRLHNDIENLRDSGIEVFVNVEAAKSEADFGEIAKEFPDFIYTYGDIVKMYELTDAVGASGWLTYPMVFCINKDHKITYFSQGYIDDVDSFISQAYQNATNKGLPKPDPVDENISGAYFGYTGDQKALKNYIDKELKQKKEFIYVYDATYTGNYEDWNETPLYEAMIEAIDSCKTIVCDFNSVSTTYYLSEYMLGLKIEYDTHYEWPLERVEATCYSTGLTAGSMCWYCNKVLVKQEVIEVKDHTAIVDKAVEPTCVLSGLTEGKHCSICKEVLKAQEPIEKLGHAYGEWKTVKEAGCTETGSQSRECSRCKDVQTEEIEALGHTEAVDEAIKETCTSNGLTEGSHCSICGDILVEQQFITAPGHKWDNGTVMQKESCTLQGITEYTCIECGLVRTETSTKLGHDYSTKWTIDKKATTSANGSKSKHCTRCDAKTSVTIINKASNVKLATASYVYNGKMRTPSVVIKDSKGNVISSSNYTLSKPSGRKNVGNYTYKITFKNEYSGTKSLTLTINPKGTTISSLTKASKAITVKWKKQSEKMATARITGYQIQYSTNKKFTNPKTNTVTGYNPTSKKITGLKAKTTYYVRIRTYKTVTVNGKSVKLYSGWSTAKSVKTK